jgi:ubiquinol-cytochrome c reductase cytochrome b subunit
MNTVLQWIDQRTGLSAGWRQVASRRVPGGACPCHSWPAAILFTFLVQVVTGVVVLAYYSPGIDSAWESVYYVKNQVTAGWLLHAMHHVAANVLLVLVGLYGIQLIVTGALKAPRELVFWTVVALGLCCLGLMLTGDLLAWDRNSYSATHVRVSFVKLLPVVGDDLFKVAVGGPGPNFGQLTLPRFLALHAGAFSGGFLVLLVLLYVFRRRADALAAGDAERATSYWPRQAMINGVACLVVAAVILGLSLGHGTNGVPLGSPADTNPAAKFDAARPEWAFLGLYEFAHLYGEIVPDSWPLISWGGIPIFVVPGLIVAALLAMPFFARSRGGHYFNLGLCAFLLLAMLGLSLNSLARDAKNEAHQAAIAEEQMLAQRVRLLIEHRGGVPPEGGLALLENDPKTRGPALYAQHCASCHPHVNAQGEGIPSEEPSAPNLHGYATREWMAGWLDPETIAGPERFGKTAFADGDMVYHVKDTLSDLAEDEKEEVRQLAALLSAEADLPAQARIDARDADKLEEAKEFLDIYGCFDCHKFHDQGSLGDAPDLTGYGSREWTTAIIANPAHPRFYGDRNDRMPLYAEEEILTARQIGLIADWLRGDWYEPGSAN